MTLATTALILLTQTSGSTLDASELAGMLYDTYKQDAVVLYANPTKIARPNTSDPEETTAFLKKQGLSVNRATGVVVFQDTIPDRKAPNLQRLFNNSKRERASYRVVTLPESAVKDETVTFETKPGEALDIASFTQMKIAKPVKVSAYFGSQQAQQLLLGVKVKNMPVNDFLRMVAKASGGRLRLTPKDTLFELDAVGFRSRASKYLLEAFKLAPAMEMPKEGSAPANPRERMGEFRELSRNGGGMPPTKQAIQLLADTINQMPNNQLESAFEFDQASAVVNLGQVPGLQNSVGTYLRAFVGSMGGQNSPMAGLLSTINPASPGTLTLTGNFGLNVALNVRRGRGGPGGPQGQAQFPVL